MFVWSLTAVLSIMHRSMIRGLSLTLIVSSLIAVQAAPSFTNQSQSTTGNSSKPTQPALVPAVHWNTKTGDLKALDPTVNQSLYYSAGGVSGKIPNT